MKAIIFPGQGSQIVGMGSEFYNNFPAVKKLFEEADEKLGFKISKIIFEILKLSFSSASLNIFLTISNLL